MAQIAMDPERSLKNGESCPQKNLDNTKTTIADDTSHPQHGRTHPPRGYFISDNIVQKGDKRNSAISAIQNTSFKQRHAWPSEGKGRESHGKES